MNGNQTPKASWFEQWITPTVLLPVAAMLFAAATSYDTFKGGTHDDVAKIQWRLDADERALKEHADAINDNTKFREDVNTELALLKQEHRR